MNKDRMRIEARDRSSFIVAEKLCARRQRREIDH